MQKFSIFILILFCICPLSLLAQRSLSFSAGVASAYYYGDLTDQLHLSTIDPGFAISASAYITSTISLRLSLNAGRIGAADSLSAAQGRQLRNLSFTSYMRELSSVAVWHLIRDKRFGRSWMDRAHISPYLFGGIALFGFDPQAEWNGELVRLQPLGTEGQYLSDAGTPSPYRLVQIGLPFGGGISARLGANWGVRAELGYRLTFTDYLDDVSTVYPEPDALLRSNGSLAVELSNRSGGNQEAGNQRGNPGAKDSYLFGSLVFVYYLAPFR